MPKNIGKKGTPSACLFCRTRRQSRAPGLITASSLARVVHLVFEWMGGHTETGNVLHLQFNVGVNHFAREYTATGQELAILVEILKRLFQAGADGRNFRVFLDRKSVV